MRAEQAPGAAQIGPRMPTGGRRGGGWPWRGGRGGGGAAGGVYEGGDGARGGPDRAEDAHREQSRRRVLVAQGPLGVRLDEVEDLRGHYPAQVVEELVDEGRAGATEGVEDRDQEQDEGEDRQYQVIGELRRQPERVVPDKLLDGRLERLDLHKVPQVGEEVPERTPRGTPRDSPQLLRRHLRLHKGPTTLL